MSDAFGPTDVRPFPKSRAESPELSSPYGLGAEAAWGIYLRGGSPMALDRLTGPDWVDFRSGYRAAYEVIVSQHERNLAVARQQLKQLTQQLRNARDELGKLRADLRAAKKGADA